MRIALVNLTGGGLSGGYRKYLRMLIPHLLADPRVEHLHIFSPAGMDASPGVGTAHTRWPSQDRLSGYRTLRRVVRESRPDVVFIPSARWLDFGRPTAAMVRNMEPLLVPFEGNPPAEALRNVLRAWTARYSVTRAARVIAVSHFVREFLTDRWAIPESKIEVVYHGVDEPGLCDATSHPTGSEPFLLTVGSIRPARGLEDLFDALVELRSRGVRLRLLVAGAAPPAFSRYGRHLRARADQVGLGAQIKWLGELDTHRLSVLYQSCAAFVMTTRAEACPNTALEAMASRTLCIAPDAPPMPEMFRDAALYYRRGDASHLAAVLHHILIAAPEKRRTTLRETARQRARDFTWAKTAAQTVATLETLA